MSIDIRNLTKRFGETAAVDGVSLVVPDGKLVALLGPSGSGKTTLLRAIAGLEFPDSGEIFFDGRSIADRGAGQRGIGFVFQHYALFRHMTVFENIAFGLRVRPWRSRPSRAKIRAKVIELLELIQLKGQGDRYPSQLSGGQRQRVALARALAIQPKLLLLDEPFGALDARVRESLRRWLRRLHEQIHVTSVFVTHDQEEALELADIVVVMNKGRIEQVGTPDEVFHRPANRFVMEFLGNVNLFHGRVDGGRAVLAGANGTPARVMVRPHDLEILTSADGDGAGVAARVTRVQSAGPKVKVELERDGEGRFHAELSHEVFGRAPVVVGQEVVVKPKNAFVFEEDYSI
ncbi:MAG TPA: sulfate/molybdate ABC transporter ATP-binding protein [Tepidisphaeraceae bacterium]|jgi:sulfate transport system ATP-binding protein